MNRGEVRCILRKDGAEAQIQELKMAGRENEGDQLICTGLSHTIFFDVSLFSLEYTRFLQSELI